MGGFNGLCVGMRQVYIWEDLWDPVLGWGRNIYERIYGTLCQDEVGICMGGFKERCVGMRQEYICEEFWDSVQGWGRHINIKEICDNLYRTKKTKVRFFI